MNKLAITSILAAAILVAGIFALVPVQFKNSGIMTLEYKLERAFQAYYGYSPSDSAPSAVSYEKGNCIHQSV